MHTDKFIWIFWLMATAMCMDNLSEYGEYCQTQMFNASCPTDHVILMEHAHYGRMQQGTCVKENYGHIGCYSDVITLADSRCSGKQFCSIAVPDPLFDKTQHKCPEDLKPYLEVRHSCVPVQKDTPSCTMQSATSTHSQQNTDIGYILNSSPNINHCGGFNTPWIIKTKPGQNLKLILYDLSISARSVNTYPYIQCHLLAMVREISGNIVKNITVCGRNLRDVVLLDTEANHVEVITRPSLPASDSFIIRYEVTGCPELKTPAHSWVVRSGDSLLVKCNHTKQMYHLNCEGNVWNGLLGNCTAAGQTIMDDQYRQETVPFGVSVFIVIIIALIIGLVVLALGLLFLKRQHGICAPREARHEPIYVPNKEYNSSNYYPTYSTKSGLEQSSTVDGPPPCTPLITHTSTIYGQLPTKLTCGCPLYMSRDEVADLHTARSNEILDTSNDGYPANFKHDSTELLNIPNSNVTNNKSIRPKPPPRSLAAPDLTFSNNTSQKNMQNMPNNSLNDSYTTSSMQNDVENHASSYHQQDMALRLRLDNALNEAISVDSKVGDNGGLKTQVVKPMTISLPYESMPMRTFSKDNNSSTAQSF